MPQTFPPHGRTQFAIEGRVVRLHVEGPWNKELVIESHQRLSEALLRLPSGPWALMVVIVGSALCPPDALEQIRATTANEAIQTSRIATAWVMGENVEGGSLMTSALRKTYLRVNKFEIFHTEDDAKQWLHAALTAQLGAQPDLAQ
jgi:hypothetical protein